MMVPFEETLYKAFRFARPQFMAGPPTLPLARGLPPGSRHSGHNADQKRQPLELKWCSSNVIRQRLPVHLHISQ